MCNETATWSAFKGRGDEFDRRILAFLPPQIDHDVEQVATCEDQPFSMVAEVVHRLRRDESRLGGGHGFEGGPQRDEVVVGVAWPGVAQTLVGAEQLLGELVGSLFDHGGDDTPSPGWR